MIHSLTPCAKTRTTAAATLVFGLFLTACAADLRESPQKATDTPLREPAAVALLTAAVEAHGMTDLDARYATYEATGADDWRGLMGNMGELWPWESDRMALRYTVGDFDGQVEALEGEHAGETYGLQSFDFYAGKGAAADTDIPDDERVSFGLTA